MRWLAGALGPLAVALLLIPAGRAVAWIGLLAAAATVGRFAGRDAGFVAGASAGFLFMWIHGPDRFAGRISDDSVIRSGFLLLVAAVLAVAAADLWHRRRLRVATVEADRVRRRRRSLDG